MGIVQTEITLKNLRDNNLAGGGYIKPENIRTATVTVIADTSSMYLIITEEFRQILGLEINNLALKDEVCCLGKVFDSGFNT